ncbi:MAG: bifunctional diaminohydroxyphosphoribosylaminopyrimidine deaminase/5-amino-6-(5-phosphoribosylamino)uracil reductase RibD [Candidatus Omnitrophica bacterium]|nr:bifunctional diaminohydroxyphosphoribosylaminopyrimidine deaminase/5-amino-6-(5-phosphoribosylamino)uracil reductase RibD [Candidatus Omnitrophota bacterium]MDD5429179.1 bifunctional diaminohydroxyphosphoribosylaminopyrimidine deaminase/5-amino-6-(5-phosphoribosylamino)uracil reductase RibD [Candidatus Omnitrophota bacterium]
MKRDDYYLREALKLAKKAEGFTSPNPLVGAVIVKNGKVIASGYHKACGGNHAEIKAIKNARDKNIKGSTLYINLEPCCHFGKTPPCVDEVIKQKIKRVVIATLDPNPQVNGRSVTRLKKAGVKVTVGVLSQEARKLNEVFFKNMRKALPFVVAKTAQSLDGKIATSTGQSKWITNSGSRYASRALRDKYDAILVGVNTVLEDNPCLAGLKRVPFRVVIDPNLKINQKTYILKHNPEKTIIVTASADKCKLKKLSDSITVLSIKRDKTGTIPLKKVLKSLYGLGIMSIFVEGGSKTLGNFFDAKLIDKAYFFIAPKIIGGSTALGSIGAKGQASLNKAPVLKDIEIEKIKQDILVYGYPQY